MKKETVYTIAERLGVSATTVSRVLNGNSKKYRISKETAARVMEEVSKSDYLPKTVKRGLNSKKSGMIGLLVPSVANVFFSEMASVIISEVNNRHYTTLVIDTQEDEYKFSESLKAMVDRHVEGILAIPCGDDPSLLERVNYKVPVVLMDRYFDNTSLSYVTANNYQGACMATKALIAAGHRKIAVIQGAVTSMPNKQRVQGYVDTMTAAGLADEIEIVGNAFSTENGYNSAQYLINRVDGPTALFVLNNSIMLGVMKAAKDSCKKFPEDISVVSFDHNVFMEYLNPRITSIGQPVEDMSKLAVKLLFDRIENQDAPVSQIKLSPQLIPGESVGKCTLDESVLHFLQHPDKEASDN